MILSLYICILHSFEKMLLSRLIFGFNVHSWLHVRILLKSILPPSSIAVLFVCSTLFESRDRESPKYQVLTLETVVV